MSRDLQRSGAAGWLLDPYGPTADRAEADYRFSGGPRSWTVPAIAGGVLLLLAVVGWLVNPPQFYFSYLVGWLFCVTVSLGAMFLVVIQHLSRSRWSVVVRRIVEKLVAVMQLLADLSYPICVGMIDQCRWLHVE